MARIRICKEAGCKDAATTAGYCRLHYLKNWKRIKSQERKRAARRLNKYVEGVIRRHPKRYIEIIKDDIKKDKFRLHDEDRDFSEGEDESVFDESTYDEEVRELIEKLKNKSD